MTEYTSIGYPCSLKRDYDPVNKEVNTLLNNIGDPFGEKGTFAGESHEAEKKLILRVADLWGIPHDGIWGYTTAGSTEGNLEGVYIAREKFPAGVLYMSDNVHYSNKKVAKILRMPAEIIKTNARGEMDLQDFAERLNDDLPAIVLVNVGSTMVSAVDDVKGVKEILVARDVKHYIHADAAFMGFVMKVIDPAFGDFKYYDSVVVSGHKYPGTPFPCGVFVGMKHHMKRIESYEDVIHSCDKTILSSRSGHSALFLNHFFDTVDLKAEVTECLRMTEYTLEQLCVHAPLCNAWKNERSLTVVFDSPSGEIVRKWCLASSRGISHVICTNHVTKDVVDEFVKDMSVHFSRKLRRSLAFKNYVEPVVSTFHALSKSGLPLFYMAVFAGFLIRDRKFKWETLKYLRP